LNPRKRLLVLDDDQAVASTIHFIATAHGSEVRLASTHQEFFAQIDEWNPNCLLLDLVMPGMDGMEVLRILAERGCSAEIILTSGMGRKVLDSAQRSGRARGLQVRGVLPKPFKPPQLRHLLDAALPPRPAASTPNPESRSYSAEDIARAVRAGELLLHYQPKIELASGRTIGFEALLRWQHPQHGMVGPMQFVPVAEQSELIGELTAAVVEQGLQWLSTSGIPADTTLSINLSANSLHDVQLADRLQARCTAHDMDPSRIVLELTETSAMRNPADAFDTLTRLRIKGFALAIDDFGTGFSSMVQLARLPFSWIKIDKSFVMTMIANPESRKIVEATIYLGKGLNLTTVAEGVEDEAALQMLKELGCDYAQGFHIARPMPGPAAVEWRAARGL